MQTGQAALLRKSLEKHSGSRSEPRSGDSATRDLIEKFADLSLWRAALCRPVWTPTFANAMLTIHSCAESELISPARCTIAAVFEAKEEILV
jgi:hypothetical protein